VIKKHIWILNKHESLRWSITTAHRLPWFVRRQPSAYPTKTWEWMLHHRPVYWDNCRVVLILRTIWCSWRADREFALINQRQSSNLCFRTLRAKN